jgi:mono/diheme cytochrome c family protein
MKEQPAVQALERVRPLAPPDGTIPLGGLAARIADPIPAFSAAAAELTNPFPSSPESIGRGKYVYTIHCALCHGANGLAENEVTPPPLLQRLKMRGDDERVPGENMIPVTLENTPAYEDGFLFTKIRYGRPVMPGYAQIPPDDRWHVVNYLRSLFPRED